MALLVDKLRPRSLDALTYHKDLSDRLASLVRRHCCEHHDLGRLIHHTLPGILCGLPTFTRLWPIWRWKENSHPGDAPCYLWQRR